MPDLTESSAAMWCKPDTRSSIENAVAELGELVKIVKVARDLDDETLDTIAWRGDALLDRIVGNRALSLCDVLLKLELWRRLPAELWDSGRVIDSVVVDLEELSR